MAQSLAQFFSLHLIKDVAEEADSDPDAASFHWLCLADTNPEDASKPPQEAAGAMVFIKGDANARALSAWLEERGLITRPPQ